MPGFAIADFRADAGGRAASRARAFRGGEG
jgi:hypothetical protein